MPDDFSVFEDYARPIAGNSIRRYRDYTTADDVFQELCVWWVQHPRLWTELLAEAEEDAGALRLRRRLGDVAESFCRREKAAISGYEPSDEWFYSTRLLRELLPMVLAGPQGAVLPGEPEGGHQRSGRPPEEGNDLSAMYADISWALERLPESQCALLTAAYLHGSSDAELGETLGVTAQVAGSRLHRAVRRLQRLLGGRAPIVDEPQGGDHPGVREIMSSATAVARTEDTMRETS